MKIILALIALLATAPAHAEAQWKQAKKTHDGVYQWTAPYGSCSVHVFWKSRQAEGERGAPATYSECPNDMKPKVRLIREFRPHGSAEGWMLALWLPGLREDYLQLTIDGGVLQRPADAPK